MFEPETGEDEATNPGIFGKELAVWLKTNLEAMDVATGDVIPEDFGWLVPIDTSPHSTFVVCANDEESTGVWRLFVFAEGGMLARLLGKDERKRSVSELHQNILDILNGEGGISDIEELDT